MLRTQLHLTERQRDELAVISRNTGKNQSELIRDAGDGLMERASPRQRDEILRRAAGIWKERKDLPDLKDTRAAWDRG